MIRYNKKEEIGQMRERIVIQTATPARGSDGSDIETWSTLATVWSAVNYKASTSNEKEVAGKENSALEVEFRIRKRTDVTVMNRVFFDYRHYDIEAIGISPDQQYMTLSCKAINL